MNCENQRRKGRLGPINASSPGPAALSDSGLTVVSKSPECQGGDFVRVMFSTIAFVTFSCSFHFSHVEFAILVDKRR